VHKRLKIKRISCKGRCAAGGCTRAILVCGGVAGKHLIPCVSLSLYMLQGSFPPPGRVGCPNKGGVYTYYYWCVHKRLKIKRISCKDRCAAGGCTRAILVCGGVAGKHRISCVALSLYMLRGSFPPPSVSSLLCVGCVWVVKTINRSHAHRTHRQRKQPRHRHTHVHDKGKKNTNTSHKHLTTFEGCECSFPGGCFIDLWKEALNRGAHCSAPIALSPPRCRYHLCVSCE